MAFESFLKTIKIGLTARPPKKVRVVRRPVSSAGRPASSVQSASVDYSRLSDVVFFLMDNARGLNSVDYQMDLEDGLRQAGFRDAVVSRGLSGRPEIYTNGRTFNVTVRGMQGLAIDDGYYGDYITNGRDFAEALKKAL